MSAAKRPTEQQAVQPVQCPEVVQRLVERFGENRESYRAEAYNETQARREFIDPLFEALGWDMENKEGVAEAYKDVIHEDAIKIGGATKAPDYCFRIARTRKFFVEAKKPAANVAQDADLAYQLRRYAWSAKLPLSILTDFEELAVYDCRSKPARTDPASKARVLLLTYRDYITRWGELAGIFSLQAIRKGFFDKYAESTGRKRGTAEVDDAFLKEIEQWRDLLAHSIAIRNPQLSSHELNTAVGLVIDRIIFLRICEDRGIESYGQLHALLNGVNVYPRLCELFIRADDRYNSGLFHFRRQKGRPEPDELTPELDIDDDALKDIIRGLYYPDSPYEFSVLPADILGQVYEQFLGKVIRLTPGHRAVVEYKPEVKKAGGVYYTPTYIVDYIVEHTVGKLLNAKTPREVAGLGKGKHPLRVLDPACGSGSFLIGAYQRLLDWHRDWYIAHVVPLVAKGKAFGAREVSRLLPRRPGEQAVQPVYQMRNGDWRLTTGERKRILLTSIYGVDIDAQAVEVTKLSLLLKVLEGETAETMAFQSRFWHDRALPDLAGNIKCGNSLIGPDFYANHQGNLFGEDEQYRINAFDWQHEFPEALAGKAAGADAGKPDARKDGGFDAVIGNPPYGADLTDYEKNYIRSRYRSYGHRFDRFIYFIEKALGLACRGGFVSMITPHLWLQLDNCRPLRALIAASGGLANVRLFGETVFEDAVVNTAVFVLQKGVPAKAVAIESPIGRWRMATHQWQSAENLAIECRLTPRARRILNKVQRQARPLSAFGELTQGITPYDRYRGQSAAVIQERKYHSARKVNAACGRWLSGGDVRRYGLSWSREWLRYGPWLAAPREPRFFRGPRLLFREVPGAAKRIQVALVTDRFYHGHSITPFRITGSPGVPIECLLAIVNSQLLSWYAWLKFPNFGKDVFPKLNPQDIASLPIAVPSDAKLVRALSAFAARMMALDEQLPRARGAHDKEVIQRQIDATDREIDCRVYELYGLTEDDIRIVEEGTA